MSSFLLLWVTTYVRWELLLPLVIFAPLAHTSLLPQKLRQQKNRRNAPGRGGAYQVSTKGRHSLSPAVGLRSRCFIEILNYMFVNIWQAYRTYVVARVKANGLPTSNLNYQNPRTPHKRMWVSKWLSIPKYATGLRYWSFLCLFYQPLTNRPPIRLPIHF